MRYLLFLLFLLPFTLSAQTTGAESHCITATEQELADIVNAYRQSKGLEAVPLSANLSYVARTHARDLAENHPHSDRCNLHSWSDAGNWGECCYTSDHSKAECMWEKPRELSSYPGDGFEIAYWTTDRTNLPQDALETWQTSRGHHDVILSRGQWRDYPFQAMGVGVYEGYVTVWFGGVEDPAGEPATCE